jgi:hypothetical protein
MAASIMNTSADSTSSSLDKPSAACSVYESFSLISGLPLQIECITGYGKFLLMIRYLGLKVSL